MSHSRFQHLAFGLTVVFILGGGLLPRPTLAVVDKTFYTNLRVVSVVGGTTISWNTTSAIACNSVITVGVNPNRLNFGQPNAAGNGFGGSVPEVACAGTSTSHSAIIPTTLWCSQPVTSGVCQVERGVPATNAASWTPANGDLILMEIQNSGKESGQKSYYNGDITLSSITVTNITKTSATLNFTSNSSVCTDLNYGLSAGALTTTIAECNIDAGLYVPSTSHSIQLNGLTKDTDYFAVATTFDTNTASTPQVQFRTLGDTPIPGRSEITSVNIVSVSPTQATLTFTYSSQYPATDLRYTVNYGKTTKYGLTVANHAIDNQPINLQDLDPETTYHFSIQLVRNTAVKEELATSADRAFTTPRNTSGSLPLTIDKIRLDCIDRACTVFFSTNKDAIVDFKWVLGSSPDTITFPATNPFVTETVAATGVRSFRIPNSTDPVLSANTVYRYKLHGKTADNFEYTTGELSFTTSGSSTDHLFATGKCVVGTNSVDIGQCIGDLYCYGAGLYANDCTKCGFSCGAGLTCRAGVPVAQCREDAVLNGSATQCNDSSCYTPNGIFRAPAAAKCYASWPRCNANTILKVRKDRGCNLWLSCTTSIQTDATSNGPADNLCLNLGACNSLNTKGQCNHYLPLGQCSNDALRFCNQDTECQFGGTCNNPDPNAPTRALQTLTFQTPKDVKKIADLSGNVTAGLDWGIQGGANIIQGNLPWQLMRQIGGTTAIKNGDMEYNVPNIDPWEAAPAGALPKENIKISFEDRDSGPNHVLSVDPRPAPMTDKRCEDVTTLTNSSILKTCIQNSDCNPGAITTGLCVEAGKCSAGNPSSIGKSCTANNDAVCNTSTLNDGVCQTSTNIGFTGVRSAPFSTTANEYYYAEARIRSTSSPLIRMQFRHSSYASSQVSVDGVTTDTFVDIAVTNAWQRVTLGPLKGMSGDTYIAFVCPNDAYCSPFEIDDVVVKPVLQVNTSPSYVAPTCRLYPKSDAPACDYADSNGVNYKGWKGYCLEHDSQTGTCLSWWPVDIIKGESNIFGADKVTGYQDRAPLYLCAESAGGYVDATLKYYKRLTATRKMVGDTSGNINCAYVNDAAHCFPGEICMYGSGYYPTGNDAPLGGANFTVTDASERAIFESDIDHIDLLSDSCGNQARFNLKITAETTIAAGGGQANCDGLYAGLPWSICSSVKSNESGYDYIAIHFEFDPADHGRLKSIWTKGLDEGTDDGGVVIDPRFFMKEQCTKLVQVVTASGDNKAFSSRINSGSFKVSDLNYSKSTDLTPFGASVNPTGDISNWSVLNAVQPNYSLQPIPGVPRSGSPYACNGKCEDVICTADNTSCLKSGVLDPTLVRRCQNQMVGGNHAGDCIGVASLLASSRGPQVISSNISPVWGEAAPSACPASLATAICPTSKTATIQYTAFCGAGGVPSNPPLSACNSVQPACNGKSAACAQFDATAEAVRYDRAIAAGPVRNRCGGGTIAALYYGTCVLSSATNYLSVSTANANNAVFAQSHMQRLFAQSYGVYTFNPDTREYVQDTSVANWLPPKEICMKNPAASGTACGTTIQSCTQTKAVTGTAAAISSTDAQAKVTATANAWKQCGLKTDGTVLDTCSDTNNSNPKIGIACTTATDCLPAGAAPGYNTQKCGGAVSVPACSGVSTCPGGTIVPFNRFVESSPCSYANNTFTCRGQCTTNKTYVQAGITPAGLAPKLLRPVPVAGSTADYCAIPPTVSNVKFVNGTSNISTIEGGSGTISIKFNTDADADQQPLKKILIDWGDTTEDFGFPFAPRNDPAKPHIFSHTYVTNRGDNAHCTPFGGRFVCQYPIKIQVTDNWDWANDAVRIGDQSAPDGTDDIQSQTDHTKWFDTQLKVNVNP